MMNYILFEIILYFGTSYDFTAGLLVKFESNYSYKHFHKIEYLV